MKIKIGNLNYDQSGRAYPDDSHLEENWTCIWENEGKYYKLVSDDQHKEWDEVNIYNHIIDKAYREYFLTCIRRTKEQEKIMKEKGGWLSLCLTPYFESKDKFIEKIKTEPEFYNEWGLKIGERELSEEEKVRYFFKKFGEEDPLKILKGEVGKYNIPTKLITITYKNETIESYE